MKKKMGVDLDSFTEQARAERLRESRARRGPELQLWHTWNNNGRKEEHLAELMKSLHPLIESQVRKFKGQGDLGIPLSAMRSQLRIAAVKGIKDFDPERGAQLSTHLFNKFRATTDFVAKNRNFSKIPKQRFEKYQELKNAVEELDSELGRPPTDAEVQARVQWDNPKDIGRLRTEIREENYGSGKTRQTDEIGVPSEVRSIIQITPGVLVNDDEKKVFDKLFPATGAQTEPINQIAKSLGMPANRVYRIRSRIYKKIEPHLKKI